MSDLKYSEAAAMSWIKEVKKNLEAHGPHLSVEALEELRKMVQRLLIRIQLP